MLAKSEQISQKNVFKTFILPILIAGIWIGFSEFLRNEILFKFYWVDHFESLGLKFETLPVNGILWFVWSFIMAYIIYALLQKFDFLQTFILSWLAGFVLMWITVFNLQVLPLGLLIIAIPLSMIEVIVAILIIQKS